MRKADGIYDVIIVGAGPIGLYLSQLLAKEGFETLVIEKKKRIGEGIVCAGIVGKEAFEKFALPKCSILKEITGMRVVSPNGGSFSYDWGSVMAYVIDRQVFDRMLFEDANFLGVRVSFGEKVNSVRVEDGYAIVESQLIEPFDRKRRLAKLVVLATGVETDLHRSLNLGYPESYLIGVNVSIRKKNDGILTILTGSRISKGGFGWVVPESTFTTRLGLITESNPRPYMDAVFEMFGVSWCGNLGIRPISQGLVSRTYGDRVISVGECAGQVKTTTGGGIYFGLISSLFAFETIKTAMKVGDFSKEVLRSYEENWKQKLGSEIVWGKLIRKLWKELSDRDIERLFDCISSDGFLERILRNFEFDWHVRSLMKVVERKEVAELLGFFFL